MNIDWSDYIFITVITKTGFSGCDHKDIVPIYRDYWEAMTEDERQKEVMEIGLNNVGISGYVSDEDGEYIKGIDE